MHRRKRKQDIFVLDSKKIGSWWVYRVSSLHAKLQAFDDGAKKVLTHSASLKSHQIFGISCILCYELSSSYYCGTTMTACLNNHSLFFIITTEGERGKIENVGRPDRRRRWRRLDTVDRIGWVGSDCGSDGCLHAVACSCGCADECSSCCRNLCELRRRLIKSPKVADVDTLLVKTSWLFSINYADNTDAPTSAARLVAAARSGLCNFEGRSWQSWTL